MKSVKIILATCTTIFVAATMWVACTKEGNIGNSNVSGIKSATNQEMVRMAQCVPNDSMLIGYYSTHDDKFAYIFDPSELAQTVEQYMLENNHQAIVYEIYEILDSLPLGNTIPEVHFSYFDIDRGYSVNQWFDVEKKIVSDNVIYYTLMPEDIDDCKTDKPGPGLWNIRVFTCEGKCNQMCEKKDVDEVKTCMPCKDEVTEHKCEGNTTEIGVLSYIASILGNIFKITISVV